MGSVRRSYVPSRFEVVTLLTVIQTIDLQARNLKCNSLGVRILAVSDK